MSIVLGEAGAGTGEVVQQAGAVVTGEQLFHECWPNVTMVGANSDGQQAMEVGARQAMQLIEGPVGASTGVHVHHA
ncbi:hypothetical protein D3C72_2334490 [compost metagenome]